jgi:chromosome segregation ATPase
MSISPGSNIPDNPPPQVSAVPRWIYFAFLVLLGGIGYLGYSEYTAHTQLTAHAADLTKAQDQAAQLSTRLDQANGRIAELRGQLEVTSRHINLTQAEVAQAHSLALQDQADQKASDEKLAAQIGQVKSESDAKIGAVSNDVNGAKTDIAATKTDLEATKGKLTSAIGDVTNQGGLIARNHEELEDLKRLGERNIFDFSLGKTKTPQKVGPVQLQLTKVDTKHYRYSVLVVADDKQIEKKDKTVDELMQFYVRGARAPYEIVVFEVSKDKITGYLSTPKDVTAVPPAAKPGT